MGYKVKSKFDAHIDKAKLQKILGGESWVDFHSRFAFEYRMSLGYKGFMSLLDNVSNWSLAYAMAISKMVNVPIDELFTLVENNNN